MDYKEKMLIVHDGDSDGRTAAALFVQSMLTFKLSIDPLKAPPKDVMVLMHKLTRSLKTIKFVETRSRDDIPWVSEVDSNTTVVILDLTFKRHHFDRICLATDSVMVFDHHDGYDFIFMDPSSIRGIAKCFLRDSIHSILLHYGHNKSTTALVYSLYEHVLTNAALNMETVKENMQMMNLLVYTDGRYKSTLHIQKLAPDKNNFYLDPTWLPNKDFVANIDDFDVNRRQLPNSANFDAGLRSILDSEEKNHMWSIYHLLYRHSFLELGRSFLAHAEWVSTPEEILFIGDIASLGRQDLEEHIKSLEEQIKNGPKFIQANADPDEPQMGTFVVINCSKYQTQVAAAALEANPGFSYAIIHYTDGEHEKLSFRRNFSPIHQSVNLKELSGKLGLMLTGEERGGGHAGSAGLLLTQEQFGKLKQFIERTCSPMTMLELKNS